MAIAIILFANRAWEDGQTLAVYDLGGGTFDISVLEISSGVFEVAVSSLVLKWRHLARERLVEAEVHSVIQVQKALCGQYLFILAMCGRPDHG